jgi:hypothetical protein
MAYNLLEHQRRLQGWLKDDILAAWEVGKGIYYSPPTEEILQAKNYPLVFCYIPTATRQTLREARRCGDDVLLPCQITFVSVFPKGGILQNIKWEKAEALREKIFTGSRYGAGRDSSFPSGYPRRWERDTYQPTNPYLIAKEQSGELYSMAIEVSFLLEGLAEDFD